MRPRDSAIVAAVLLVGGFAAADALRGTDEATTERTAATGPRTGREEPDAVQTETVVGVGSAGLAGRLVFTDGRCELRELDLGDGTLLRHGSLRSSCGLIAPRRGEHVAVTLPSRRRDTVPYRLVHLADPDAGPATVLARLRSVVWSLDGSRVAWCAPSGQVGGELDLSRRVEAVLARCPVAFTPDGEPAYAEGRALVAGGQALVRAPGPITAVSFAPDGTLAVATRKELRLYRGSPGAATGSYGVAEERRAIPEELRGLPVVFSPTHCHAAFLSSVFPPTPTVFVRDLGRCPGSRAPLTFAGRAAAWSPDGSRLAVAERARVVVQAVYPEAPAVVLRVVATNLAWLG
jgi:hypothetical protein